MERTILWNARSLINKLQQFQSFVYSKNVDIICVTESWLYDSIQDSEILPVNYTVYRNDRGARGGGVLVAVKNSIPSTLIHKSVSLELLTVEISLTPKVQLVCLYVPPNCPTDYQQIFLHYTSNLRTTSESSTFILGDFNAPDINWNTLHASSSFSHELCNTFQDYSQLIDFPTHIKGNTLDIILTNVPQRTINICVSDSSLLKSDHYIILFLWTFCHTSMSIVVRLPTKTRHAIKGPL